MSPEVVHIHYLRPPDREDVYHQPLLLDRPDVKVTFPAGMALDLPIRIGEKIVLETGSRVVWFTFPGRWHDIGRFHTADGTFRGYYANILTPPRFEEGCAWYTTDLFLDVWLPPDGTPSVLDRDQFVHADDSSRSRRLRLPQSQSHPISSRGDLRCERGVDGGCATANSRRPR